jgi:hypothetical protein
VLVLLWLLVTPHRHFWLRVSICLHRCQVRLNWHQRLLASVPPALLKYCRMDDRQSAFALPPIAELRAYRIVVLTTGMAGQVRAVRKPLESR